MVACRGLLRRKLLAMTSEVAKFLAMTRGHAMTRGILITARQNSRSLRGTE